MELLAGLIKLTKVKQPYFDWRILCVEVCTLPITNYHFEGKICETFCFTFTYIKVVTGCKSVKCPYSLPLVILSSLLCMIDFISILLPYPVVYDFIHVFFFAMSLFVIPFFFSI